MKELEVFTSETEMLKAECAELRKEVKRLETALAQLVKINEAHNAAIEKVMGKPAGWTDDYLANAREALRVVSVLRGPCKYCGDKHCKFHDPKCKEAQDEQRKAEANGMPPSGRHG